MSYYYERRRTVIEFNRRLKYRTMLFFLDSRRWKIEIYNTFRPIFSVHKHSAFFGLHILCVRIMWKRY